jgi:subtilisin family serine protease
MAKQIKTNKKEICPYCLYGLEPATRHKIPVYLEKRGDRITIILKGDVREKSRQKKIIETKFGFRKINELFRDVYEVLFQEDSAFHIDAIMNELRNQRIITHHAYSPVNGKTTIYNLTDRIMIRFKNKADENTIERLLDKYKLKMLYKLDLPGMTIVVEVTNESGANITPGAISTKGKNPAKIANLLEKEDKVETAEVSLIYRLPNLIQEKKSEKSKNQDNNELKKENQNGPNEVFIPEDTLFNKQWHLLSRDEQDSNGKFIIKKGADVSAVKAWETLNGGGDKEIVVAIIDASIDFNHPDLKKQLSNTIENIKTKFAFIANNIDLNDNLLIGTDSHGTSCAGIALAEKNGKGIVGIAYGCKFLPVWLDANGSEDLKIRCFEETAKIADVISFSKSPLPERLSGVLFFKKLTEIAKSGGPRGRGCVICVSAGNYQAPINQKLTSDLKYFDHNGNPQTVSKGEIIFNLYAVHPNVITVTASTSVNTIAGYNNFGKEVSVCAPSADWSLPNGVTDLISAGICTTASRNGNLENGLYRDTFCGTSASAPLVAGIAALVLSANKDLPAEIVKKILEVSADKINPSDAKYNSNGHSLLYGYGKVNAARAVQLAIDLKMKNGAGKSVSAKLYKQQIEEIINDS